MEYQARLVLTQAQSAVAVGVGLAERRSDDEQAPLIKQNVVSRKMRAGAYSRCYVLCSADMMQVAITVQGCTAVSRYKVARESIPSIPGNCYIRRKMIFCWIKSKVTRR